MARLVTNPKLDVTATFVVNESELRALDALSGYGDDAFIKHFKESLGESYMRDHEAGLREFLKSIRGVAAESLRCVDEARRGLQNARG